jgi:hypothetical protein
MRGKKPTTNVEEAQHCAEKMGYHWVKNTVEDLPFDAIMFRQAVIAVVKVKKVRYAIDDEVIIEKKFPDEVCELQSLPLPLSVLRELWIRTQNERAWRRFYIFPETTAEIEFNTAENYRNTHFDEEKWRKAPFRIDIPLPPKKE